MTTFITEDWLRANHSLSQGTEIQLPTDCRFTPAARGLIADRQLQVKYHDQQGRLFVETAIEPDVKTDINLDNNEALTKPVLQQVHGLTSQSNYSTGQCQLCHQMVTDKPDTMTHLNSHTLVAKSDPRLAFRAKLDSAIALVVWLQTELPAETQIWLADIRSLLGNIMHADALNMPLSDFAINGLDSKMLHQLSHQPLQYLGHDHIVPAADQGRTACQLNLLRTQIRETEISAAAIFISRDLVVTRPDIMQALNRLSSAVYVLMLLAVIAESGQSWLNQATLIRRLGGHS